MSRSIGARYQVITAVIAAPSNTSPPVTRARLTASLRVRGTVWLQASRQVPNSSSRAISGAPMRTPSSPGAIRSEAQNAMLTAEPNSPVKALTAAGQLVPWLRARQAARSSWLNAVRIELPSTIAYTARAASTPRQATAWLRCWRQLTQIIVLPPSRPSGPARAEPPPGHPRPPTPRGPAGRP